MNVRLHRRWFVVPEWAWVPVASGALVMIIGLIGILARRPLLFASLGPTAYLESEPRLPTSRFYNVLVGHLIGLGAGFLAVLAVGAAQAPPVLAAKDLTMPRVWAATFALGLTVFFSLIARAPHPPAGATTILVAIGAFRTLQDAVDVFIGVLAIAVLGEGIRWLRLRRLPPGRRELRR